MPIFPEKGISEDAVRERLEEIRRQIDPRANFLDVFLSKLIFFLHHKVGDEANTYPETAFRVYSTNPHPLAIEAITKFLPYNRNNIGTHTRVKNPKGLAALEKETVLMLGDLMGAAEMDIDGYITQGGTEGNIMGLWIGRNMFKAGGKVTESKICLLKTALTHYSIDKAADILDIKKVVDIPLNPEYGMDSEKLEKNIRSLHNEGYQNFLITLTLGYNTTGTVDPVDEIDAVIRRLENDLKIKTYVHLDAAIGGLIYPFVLEKPLDFRYQSVQSISLDMHKTGFVPNTAGVFLCRKGLQRWIERPAPYIPYARDDTLSGTRPGTATVAAWSVIHALGKGGFRSIVQYELGLKNYFLKLLARKFEYDCITHPAANIAAVHFRTLPNNTLPHPIEKNMALSRYR